ncbi:hypothetical protein ACIOJD_19260 [Streptomyces sp. NPDC088116]|uniref:hypothetical protein n=1 Tax=Streptomyces sp. NPDC088116 TaxID=3365825 RepID=UPI00382E020E
MMNNAKIGVALVGGYFLGRTKKAKLAIGLGMFLAGRKLSLDPRQLSKLVANSPVLGGLNDQVRRELVDATKSAATTALTQRVSGLADSLHDRTRELDDPTGRARVQDDEVNGADEKPKPASGARKATSATRKTAPAATRKAASGTRKAASGVRKSASGAGRAAASSARRASGGRNG